MRGRRLWMEPGWLPTLEIVEWPRLAEHRAKHEAAVEALSDALKAEDGEAGDEAGAIGALCDVTEVALRDLGENLDEGESAYRAAVPKVEPKRNETPGALEPVDGNWDRWNEQAEKTNRRVREEEEKLKPKRAALERDLRALKRLRSIVEPSVLDEGRRMIPLAQAQLEAERERAAKAREAAARKDETLEQRVARLEAELERA
jgi:hypothetical protein